MTDEDMSVPPLTDNRDILQDVRKLLKSHFWLPNIDGKTMYRRLHDDHDGTRRGSIHVCFGEDGDAWILTTGYDSLRYRMPMIGGGASPHVRTALMILAEAILLDNEEHPIKQIERQRKPLEASFCIVYADRDKSPEFFDGAGAEEAARKRYQDAKMSWTCKLYQSIDDEKLDFMDRLP